MSLGEFIYNLANSGTVGNIFAMLILVAVIAWCFSMFVLPFRISHIRDDVSKIRDDVEKLSRGQHDR